ncbi:hypothetical protein GCM10008929_17830 [Alkalibacterium psychrotolerans]
MEINNIIFKAMLPVIRKWNDYNSISERVSDIKRRLKISLSKAKSELTNIVKNLSSGATFAMVAGFVSVLTDAIINSFITTSRSFGKILNDTITSIMRAFKIIFSKNPTISKREKLKEGIKIIGVGVAASLGVIISQSISEIIKADPLNPLKAFSEEIGSGVGIIMTGFLVSTFIYTIENFGEITNTIRNSFSLMKYGVTTSVKDIENEFALILDKVDNVYKEILERIYNDYQKLDKIQEMIDDFSLLAELQFKNSIEYAEVWDVPSEKIINNYAEIDKYFID